MKHDHHHEKSDDDEIKVRRKSSRPTVSIKDFDDELETRPAIRNSRGSEMLTNQKQVEASQTTERNKQFVYPIQSVWPSRSS